MDVRGWSFSGLWLFLALVIGVTVLLTLCVAGCVTQAQLQSEISAIKTEITEVRNTSVGGNQNDPIIAWILGVGAIVGPLGVLLLTTIANRWAFFRKIKHGRFFNGGTGHG